MVAASFVQTDFRGGLWSATAQGRMNIDAYKTGMNECLNSMPVEQGGWMRRPGFRFTGETRYGKKAVLKPFRFSRTQTYQVEFTDMHLRFTIGLGPLMDVTNIPQVLNITTANPAVVYVTNVGNWAEGDVVMFNVNTTGNLPTTYALFGRQFRISNVDPVTNSFFILDNFTGDIIDGATINFIPRPINDTIQRVLTFTTPYIEADLPYIRIVQATDNLIILCGPPGKVGYPPYVLKPSGLTQFTFTPFAFIDGPYYDAPADLIPGFNNTLTLSGITGSVTVTASGTTGINDGDGFKATDVGRHIWFQSGPPQWSNLITYPKAYIVLGSDGNIYQSLTSGNINHDPTTDAGTNWEITAQSIVVTWLKITAYTSPTLVTATISGVNPTSGTATIHWRLGLYSDTTAYPSCGGYHEGRLILAGAVDNRFDGSRSFKTETFSPTEIDGSVSDDNAISEKLNNKDLEEIAWVVSADDGMTVASAAGEWLIRASTLDDPVTPTSVQARNVTTYGCLFTEPIYAYGSPVFIQARQMKLMSHTRNYRGDYEAINHSEKAEGLMAPGIEDVVWVQEPLMTLFCRRSDGILIGATYRDGLLQEKFTGWHRHEHALGRTIEDISAGVDFSGKSDSLYAITWDGVGAYWIETMMPVANSGSQNWVAWHTDGSTTSWHIRRMLLSNGDSFDGIRIYGLWNLNGITVHPYIGGLDLGNFVVANGSIDIPYAGTFTAAFLSGLNDGSDYASWGIHLVWADIAITTSVLFAANTINAIDNDGGSVTPSGNRLIMTTDMSWGWRLNDNLGVTDTIRSFDGYGGNLGPEIGSTAAIFNGTPGTKRLRTNYSLGSVWSYVEPDRFLDGTPKTTFGNLFGLVDFNTYKVSSYSLISSVSLTETLNIAEMYPLLPAWNIGTNYLNTGAGNPVVNYQNKGWSCINANIGHAPNLFPGDWVQDGPQLDINLAKQVVCVPYYGTTVPEAGLTGTSTNQLAVIIGQADDGSFTLMNIINLTANGPLLTGINPLAQADTILRYFQVTGSRAYVARGLEKPNVTQFFVYSRDASFGTVYIYNYTISGPTPVLTKPLVRQLLASDINGSWAQLAGMIGFTDATDGNFVLIAQFTGTRVIKIDKFTGDILWNVAAPVDFQGYNYPDTFTPPVQNSHWGYLASDGTFNILDLTNGTWSTVAGVANGFTGRTDHDWFDGQSIITRANFLGTAAIYNGPWATAHQPSWAGTVQFNRIWLGLSYGQDEDHRTLNADVWFIPANVGVSFESRGQLLRPDFGQDGGAVAGPAFGKKRRNHWYATSIVKGYNLSIGTDFTNMNPVKLQTAGGTPLIPPTLFTGTVSDTLTDDYSFEGKIAWKVTRQYPCTITAMGGYIATQDK